MLMAPPPRSKEEFIVRFGETWNVLRAGSFPEEMRSIPIVPTRLRARPQSGRCRPAAPRSARLGQPQGAAAWRQDADTRHSRPVDPLVRPEGGKDTAELIPGAKLLMIEGMGHALPMRFWPDIIDAIAQHAHGAAAQAGGVDDSAPRFPGGDHVSCRFLSEPGRKLYRPSSIARRGCGLLGVALIPSSGRPQSSPLQSSRCPSPAAPRLRVARKKKPIAKLCLRSTRRGSTRRTPM